MIGSCVLMAATAAACTLDPGEETPSIKGQRGVSLLAGQDVALVKDERAPHLIPPALRPLSKKEAWKADKQARADRHLSDQALAQALKETKRNRHRRSRTAKNRKTDPQGPTIGPVKPVTSLHNLWTREILPLMPGSTPPQRFHKFLRDHFTNQATQMDLRLEEVLRRVARRFHATQISIISGYRSPKYNLMLRKKGRGVARTSRHMEGMAVDFRVGGIPVRRVMRYVRALRLGGVGYYPRSRFVHCDTGPIRTWHGS